MKTALNTVIQFNPSERIKKGEACRKVAMEHVHVFSRCITEWENVTYNGGAKFRNGDTLLARITPCLENGKTAMVSFLDPGEVACGSTEFIVLRAIKGKTDPFFVYYLAISNLFRDLAIKSMVGSTGRQRVQQSVIENIAMDIPTLAEQRKIVAVLSAFDSKIELNAQINQNLEQQAQAIFKSWFVDFEPFGGAIPSGWQETHLSQIADFVSGYSYKGNELQPSDCAMATIKNFDRNGGFKLDGFKEIVPSRKLKDVQQVDLFDILVAHTDLTQNAEVIGNTELILSKAGYKKLIMSMDLVKVVPKLGISKFLLASLLRSPQFKAHALGYVNGTTVLHMSKSALPEYCFYFPTEWSSLEGISAALERMYHKMSQTIEESHRLATLRDTLLPKLLSGEIDVSEVEV